MLFLFQLPKRNKSRFRIEKHEFADHSNNCNGSFATDENVQNWEILRRKFFENKISDGVWLGWIPRDLKIVILNPNCGISGPEIQGKS